MDDETLRHLSFALDNHSPNVRIAILDAIQAWLDAARTDEQQRSELKDARHMVYEGMRNIGS